MKIDPVTLEVVRNALPAIGPADRGSLILFVFATG